MATDFCCLIGAGEVFGRPKGVAGAVWRSFGNVTSMSIGHDEDVKVVRDGITGSGNACQVRLISAVNIEMTLNCFKMENWELAMFGEGTRLTGLVAVTDEPHGFEVTDTVYLANVPKASPAPVVKIGATLGAATTLVLNTDYTLGDGGRSIVPTTAGAMDGGAGISVWVGYTPQEQITIEGLVNSGVPLEMIWKGVNKGENDLPIFLHMYNVRFGAAADLALLSDDFAAMELSGELTADTGITGVGLSKYYRLQYTPPAA